MSKELAELRENLKSAIRELEEKLTDIFNRIDKIEPLNRTISVDDLELNVRAANVFYRMGIKTTADLVELTPDDLLRTPNFGNKSLREVREALGQYGLHLNGDKVYRP